MIALSFRFPAGRYHATPWGRHVNEAAVAWPPEPYRVLRALIATYHRKADRERFSEETLADLIDALAGELPRYRLPDAVHAHTRHYMPAPVKTTLVFDAFARFDPGEQLIVGWPSLTLDEEQQALLAHLAGRLGYLGRAESWVEAEVIDWRGEDANALPLNEAEQKDGEAADARTRESLLTPVYASLGPGDYATERAKLLSANTDKPKSKARRLFEATLPERLVGALSVDTADLQAVGWSDPPAARRVLYTAPEPTSTWRGFRRRREARKIEDPTVARFVLAGRPRPRVEDTIKIAEIMRRAAIYRWAKMTGPCKEAPWQLSGHEPNGEPLREQAHSHAFWLPEDADNDGEIDHIVVYAAGGFDDSCRRALDRVTRLWIEKRGRANEEEAEAEDSGRKEWRLALEGFGVPQDFAEASTVFAAGNGATRWISVTPYLMPWHEKKGFGLKEQIVRELIERGFPEPKGFVEVNTRQIRGRDIRPIHFHRFRSRRGLTQPDRLGRFVELTLEQPVIGPLALGFGCHFGLGLFRPSSGDG